MNEVKVASIFLLGATIGGGGAYWVAASTLKKGYDRAVQAEVEEVREHYKAIHKDRSYATPEDYAAEKAEQASVEEEYNMQVSAYAMDQERVRPELAPTTEGSKVEERSIFTQYGNLADPEKEEVVDHGAIQVVTFEEFNDDDDYTKTTLTYYKGDDTVADEMDEIMADAISAVGPDALATLNDQDSVYIRNDHLRASYEILLEEGAYGEIVLNRR